MDLRKRSATTVYAVLAAVVFAVPVMAQSPEGVDLAARATIKQDALVRVVEALKESAVRPVEEHRVLADAKRIVAALRADQIEALAAGEEWAEVNAMQPEATASEDGGLRSVTANAVGDADSDLLYVPVAPCRIIDTRLGGGKIAAGSTRAFRVAGTDNFPAQGGKSGGCGVPMGASSPLAAAVMLNIVAIDVDGKGNLAAWEFGQPEPLASSINFQKIDMNIANGLIVPIAGVSSVTHDLNVKANFSNAHLVVDVTGYFTRFPIENFQSGLKSQLVTQDFTTLINLNDGACHELNSCTITADAPGTVVVEAWGQFVVDHTAGSLDRVAIGIETANPVVCNDPDTVNASDFDVPASLGSNPDVDFTVSHGRSFSQPGGTTRTYRLSGRMLNGVSTGDKIENSRLICTFIPD
ncbi:MAG TPA: hypothetical protein VJ885_11380 [Thermoanaerobaculia bacterium]|nr:hypothetical protein [Thermoanaerobaculia bacterium]